MAIREKQEIAVKKIRMNGFFTGIGLSLMNVFSIPFFCGTAAAFNIQGWLTLEASSMLFFAVGSSLGTYTILFHYAVLAEKIKPKLTKISTYFNYFLALVTGVAALVSLFHLL